MRRFEQRRSLLKLLIESSLYGSYKVSQKQP